MITKYNYVATEELLKIVQNICDPEKVNSSIENVDWRGQKYARRIHWWNLL